MMAPQEPSRILNVARHKPLIGIPADRRILGPHPFHCVGEKYIAAVADAADAIPVLIPALGDARPRRPAVRACDGILLTGSPSNVEPHRYAGPAERSGHAARPASRRDDAAADPARHRGGPAAVRDLPRLPGDERRVRRHALAEGAGRAGHARSPRGQGAAARRPVRAGARGGTRARAAICTVWRARTASSSIRCTRRACRRSAAISTSKPVHRTA